MSCLRNSAQRPSASGQNGCWLHATDTKHVHHIKASPSILFMIRLTETARDYGTGRLLCQRASICKHGKGTCGMVGGSKQMVGPNGFEPSTSSVSCSHGATCLSFSNSLTIASVSCPQ